MDYPQEETTKCTMCLSVILKVDYISHIVRYHKFEARFQVQCKYDGCGVTFDKWKSFRQHLWRKHRMDQANLAQIDEPEIHQLNRDVNNEDVEHGCNDANEEPPMAPMEKLKWHAAQFLLDIRENCNISQTAVDYVIDGVQELMAVYASIILDDLQQHADPATSLLHFDVVKETHEERYPPSMLFSAVNTKSAFDKMLHEKFNMISPQKVVVCEELVWKKDDRIPHLPDLVDVERYAYVVSFLDNLAALLSNDEVRLNVENPKAPANGILKSVLDGSVYRENEFFRTNRNALGIILYYDDLGIANPLGVSAKEQKLSIFYWTLANIHPELRSTRDTVQLYAIVKTQYLKKGGLQKIFELFSADIKILQTRGVTVNVRGQGETVFKGSLLFFAGDTPASALVGGFKESVSAYRPCRQCMTTKHDWRTNFSAGNFILRDYANHENHLAAINEANLPKNTSDFWKKRYGVNARSPLLDIPNFDVTTCLPQDSMHVLLEGVALIACRELLRFCIVEKYICTLAEFNNRRTNFNYGHWKNDAPGVILREHLAATGNLHQKASQMLVLTHTLPFLIGDFVKDREEEDICERMECHTLLLQILNICLAYEVRLESVDILSRMIELFILRFKRLYPDTLVPKFHFLIHVPQCILLFGPARQQWCFRFEAAHAYFKSLVPVVRNFKNMPYTLSYRHQARLCSKLATYPGAPARRFLYRGHKVYPGETLLLSNLPNAEMFHRFVAEADRDTCLIMRSRKVVIHGTTYNKKSVILLQCNDDSLPLFGQIEEVFSLRDRIVLLFSFLVTSHFNDKLNAYCVTEASTNFQDIIFVDNLIFPHPVFRFALADETYVSLINHDRNEFFG